MKKLVWLLEFESFGGGMVAIPRLEKKPEKVVHCPDCGSDRIIATQRTSISALVRCGDCGWKISPEVKASPDIWECGFA